MSTSIQIFEYEGHEIEFDLGEEDVMVNATAMAKIYGKRINDFFLNEGTKRFIEAILIVGNSRQLGIEKKEDLYLSRPRSGTWMHRVLALKFAAWLDPYFEVWVYITIDKLLNSGRRILREQARIDEKVEKLKAEKYCKDPEYAEIVDLEEKSKQLRKSRTGQYSRDYNGDRKKFRS